MASRYEKQFYDKDGQDSRDLEEWVQKIGPPLSTAFAGIKSKDEMESIPPGRFYICNIQDSVDKNGKQLPGTHWVAAGVTQKGAGWYFDSYGLPPPVEIRASLPKKSFNGTEDLQSFSSDLCGMYAIGAAYCVYMNPESTPRQSLTHYLDLFDQPTLDKNDVILHYFMMETIQ